MRSQRPRLDRVGLLPGAAVAGPREPYREWVTPEPEHSFRWLQEDYPAPLARWHYHPEIEIHLIRRGSGRYIVGDSVGNFGPGHVAVVGSNVPHDWISDGQDGVVQGRDVLVQFDPAWLGGLTELLPELGEVNTLLAEAGRGLEVVGQTAREVAATLVAIGESRGATRLERFFGLLAVICHAPSQDKVPMASPAYTISLDTAAAAAVESGLEYILANVSGALRQSEAARRAGMSESSFSRYFKKASGVTFSEMVRKLRIARAQRLLAETDDPVAEICYRVGYSNLSNFNRQFVATVGSTPSAYRRAARRGPG